MNNVPRPVRRATPWLAVAIVGALVGLALQLTVGGSNHPQSVSAVRTERPASAASLAVPANAQPAVTALTVPPATSAPGPGDSITSASQAANPAASTSAATSDPPVQTASVAPSDSSTGLRLRIPAVAIDARIFTLGFAGNGQLDVPSDGASVAWYDISPRPGDDGNALLGAHFDWDGSLAVFSRLNQLAPGDQIIIDDGSRELVYEVSVATSVGADYPLSDVLATEVQGSSLTLFTCGGVFDIAAGQYDERVVVRAVQIETSASLTARR